MEKRLPTFSPLPLLSENDRAPCMGISVMRTHEIEACLIVQRMEVGLAADDTFLVDLGGIKK